MHTALNLALKLEKKEKRKDFRILKHVTKANVRLSTIRNRDVLFGKGIKIRESRHVQNSWES